MNCASCGRRNPADARFCGGCGTSLVLRCAGCGAELRADARFCTSCGRELVVRAEKAIARKVVTVVFADLIGSVSLHERLDAEAARRFMDRYHRAMTAAVAAHGGKVVQLLGDGVLAAFGVPRVAEDDAIRAVRAGVGMQSAFRELLSEQGALEAVGLRVAVNTGEVVVSDDETAVIGDPTNVAARLQHEARDGDVVLGEGTQQLVADLMTLAPMGAFALKGRSETVTAYRVVSLDRPPGTRATAFVGRDEELRRLLAVYECAVATPGARLAVLLGSPGLGKSRLVAEFARRVGESAIVLVARCDAAGGGTFAPIAGALRSFLRIEEGAGVAELRTAIDAVVPGDEAERATIASGMAALFSGAPSSPEETFLAVRRLLAALAAVRPVVLVIDDLHWAEPLLLDLVEHLVQWSTDVPLFLLVAARPELRDARSSLATPGPLVADLVMLGALDAVASMQLAAGVVGASELPAALVGRVLATSEGNPLFLGELVRMLVQDGTLVRQGDRWVTNIEVSKLDMPPTIQVLLAARIERLRFEEQSMLERAAVIGRQFSRSALAQLLGPTPDLDVRIESLRRSELIETDTGWFLGEPALRFHHVLIRDAAYRRLLKETRAELHERLADWVIAKAGESSEHDEAIGFHLERAYQNRLDLGSLDAHGRALGERAAERLGAAGRRALARDDVSLAAGLLGRAIACLDPQERARADLALDWCEALLAAGEVASAPHAVAELGRFADTSERLRAWHACFVGQLAAFTDPKSLRATAEAVAAAAASLAAADDAAGEAKAHSVHAGALARLGKVGACEVALDQALAAARRARDRRRANAVLAGAPLAALWGPSPVTRASGRCLDVVRVLRITQGAPAVEAVALRCQAVLETLRGRGEAARRMIASARRMVEELGIEQQVLEADVFAGRIELLEADAVAAETCLRRAYEGLRERGLGIDAARAAALLGRAMLALGRAAEAETLSREAEALAGDDLQAAIAWRGVRAGALARRGEAEAAIGLARAAVAIAADTDALLDHADARMALATALRAAGRTADADAEERRSLELWESKGATLLLGRAGGVPADAARSRLPFVVADTARLRRASSNEETRDAAPPAEAIGAADDAALASLSGSARVPAARGRVRANAATAAVARVERAVAARDVDALHELFGGVVEMIDHATGATYDGTALVSTWSVLLHSAGAALRTEMLATLGESLALGRSVMSLEALADEVAPVGAIEREELILIETGHDGRQRRIETFATDHLGDAIARLYGRHAELETEEPERTRAATTARYVAAMMDADFESLIALSTEDCELVDRRRPGLFGGRGRAALERSVRSRRELVADMAVRVEAILALAPGGWLLHQVVTGVDRASGGAVEYPSLDLRLFGADGRVTLAEVFDVGLEAEALARFDALPAAIVAEPSRVRPNAATANARRMDLAVAARDLEAFRGLLAEGARGFHLPTQTSSEERETRRQYELLMAAEELLFEHEPLATLGARLALCHGHLQFRPGSASTIPAGLTDSSHLVLLEVDAGGLCTLTESFAVARIDAAIVRLYQRYAELQPEGPERDAALGVAASLTRVLGAQDADAWAPAIAEGLVARDWRTVGYGTLHGRDAGIAAFRTLLELSGRVETRIDRVLGAEPRALLVRWGETGESPDGVRFEREMRVLMGFGDDGRVVRWEQFDPEQEAAALARFDELAAQRSIPDRLRRVRPNAATRNDELLEAAICARDVAALENLFAEHVETVHYPTGITYDGPGAVARFRGSFEHAAGLVFRDEPIASLGESLALVRGTVSHEGFVSADLDVGPVEREQIVLVEAATPERRRRSEIFAGDRLAAAVVRLYERHSELAPAGPERARTTVVARAVAGALARDPDALAAVLASDVAFTDHRPLGFGTSHGADGYLRGVRSMLEVTSEQRAVERDVLVATVDALLVRSHVLGIDRHGGAFEQEHLLLWTFGSDGRIDRAELFEAERAVEALARVGALRPLAAPPQPSRTPSRAPSRDP